MLRIWSYPLSCLSSYSAELCPAPRISSSDALPFHLAMLDLPNLASNQSQTMPGRRDPIFLKIKISHNRAAKASPILRRVALSFNPPQLLISTSFIRSVESATTCTIFWCSLALICRDELRMKWS